MKTLILVILRRLHPYPAPEAVIVAEAKQERGHAGDGEVATALSELAQRGYIKSEFDELTDDRRWYLTKKGLAR